MKVIVESVPKNHNCAITVLYDILEGVLKCKSLKELELTFPKIETYGFEYGFGSSHCWVKQKDNDNRILFITEE